MSYPTVPVKILNIPTFIADLKIAHRKGHSGLRLRPRNSNRKQFYSEDQKTSWDGTVLKHPYQQDLPKEYATHFAFYGDHSVLRSVVKKYKEKGINVLHTN